MKTLNIPTTTGHSRRSTPHYYPHNRTTASNHIKPPPPPMTFTQVLKIFRLYLDDFEVIDLRDFTTAVRLMLPILCTLADSELPTNPPTPKPMRSGRC